MKRVMIVMSHGSDTILTFATPEAAAVVETGKGSQLFGVSQKIGDLPYRELRRGCLDEVVAASEKAGISVEFASLDGVHRAANEYAAQRGAR